MSRLSALQQRRSETTRFEIAEAATALFVERGFNSTTVEQIAQAAGISLRTFYRYCDSKDDALTPILVTGEDRFIELFATAPPERPLAEVVMSCFVTAMDDDARPELRRDVTTVMLTTPALRQRWLGVIRDGQDSLATVIATRFGWERDSLSATTTAAMISGAIVSALEHALRTDTPFTECLNRSVAIINPALQTIDETARAESP
jgi:AcrR family transcriptional regulator